MFQGCTDVSADESYYFHYQPLVDCLKTDDDQGRLCPVNQKGAGKRVRPTHTVCRKAFVLNLGQVKAAITLTVKENSDVKASI